jgi:hypothetical protein
MGTMDNQQIQVALEKHWTEGFSNMEDWINYNSRERECVFDASWASSTKFRERTFHTLCVEDTHWEILYAAWIQVYDVQEVSQFLIPCLLSATYPTAKDIMKPGVYLTLQTIC